ncbi:MAG: outer membrane beta-barrel protein [Verrucomicrobia bacterium]|nr:outer membrane beta-barrel protein [Verrucomicrobiota bacterium]
MKIRFVLIVAFATALFVAASARAQVQQQSAWYLTVDAAPAWMDGLTAQASGAIAASQHQSFKMGARVGAAVGYNFNEWFATEFETGYIYNPLWDADASGDRARLHRIPFIFNAVAAWRNDTIFTPYLGVGIGGMATFFDGTLDIGGTRLKGGDADVTLAYQGFVGIKTAVCECMDLNLTYKITGTLGPDFRLGSPLGASRLQLGDTLTHSISLGLSYYF